MNGLQVSGVTGNCIKVETVATCRVPVSWNAAIRIALPIGRVPDTWNVTISIALAVGSVPDSRYAAVSIAGGGGCVARMYRVYVGRNFFGKFPLFMSIPSTFLLSLWIYNRCLFWTAHSFTHENKYNC